MQTSRTRARSATSIGEDSLACEWIVVSVSIKYARAEPNLASARAGMTFGNWQAAAFVDNLTDTHTVTNYNFSIYPGDAPPLERQYTFRPRTIGLTITYRN